MIYWNIFIFFKSNAVQAIGQSKYAIDDLSEFEIGAQHLGIEIKLLQLQFVRIIREIPWLQLKVLTFQLACHFLNSFNLFYCCWFVSHNQIVE